MSVTACLQLQQQAVASVVHERGYQEAFSLIAWLTAAAFYAHGDTHSSPSSKSLFKALPSLRQTEWYPCHLSLPMSEAQPGSGVIWCRHAPRAWVRHRVTPHQA